MEFTRNNGVEVVLSVQLIWTGTIVVYFKKFSGKNGKKRKAVKLLFYTQISQSNLREKPAKFRGKRWTKYRLNVSKIHKELKVIVDRDFTSFNSNTASARRSIARRQVRVESIGSGVYIKGFSIDLLVQQRIYRCLLV